MEKLKQISVQGNTTPVVTTEDMVGHQISAMKKRSIQHATKRTEKATLRALKVEGLAMTRKQKTRLIQGAIIPVATVGTFWDIPSKKSLASLRSEILKAIWGKGRKMKSLEMVLAILNDPTLTDPLAALVYNRLSDARRLMNKSNERLLLAQHTFEFIKAETKGGDTETPNHAVSAPIFNKIQGPGAGMRQAAALLA